MRLRRRPQGNSRITCVIGGVLTVLFTALLLVMSGISVSFAADRVIVPVSVSFSGNGLPEESFSVQMTGEGGAAAAAGSVTLSAGRTSGTISLDLGSLGEGTYRYDLSELAGSDPDISYSSKVYIYTVEVLPDGSVRQSAVNRDDPADKPDRVTFTNSYLKSGPDEVIGDPPVRIRKKISGRKPPEKERFAFIMRPEKPGYPLPDVDESGSGVIKDGAAEVYIEGEGEVEIGNVRFTEEGVYRYFVSEKDKAAEGYDYDDARFTVTYRVTRDQDGRLSCERTIKKESEGAVSECAFDNIYEPSPVLRKIDRGVKTGDPAVMWPLTFVCVACMMLIALMLDRRNRREAGRGKNQGQ